MKVEAVAYYGSDVQDRTRESIAHDSGDGIDFYFRVNIFSCLCRSSRVQKHQAPKGHGGVQGFHAARSPHDTMGVLRTSTTCSELEFEGVYEVMRWLVASTL